MYSDSILTSVARIQAEPLNEHATRLYEALEVAKFVLLQLCHDAKYILQVLLHKRANRGVTKIETRAERVSHRTDQHSGQVPRRCGSYRSVGFHFDGRGFWKSMELIRALRLVSNL